MASVPFAGRYRHDRLCRFPAWRNAGVAECRRYRQRRIIRALLDHLGSGREWDLARKRGGLTIFPPSADLRLRYTTAAIGALKGILPLHRGCTRRNMSSWRIATLVCDLDYAASDRAPYRQRRRGHHRLCKGKDDSGPRQEQRLPLRWRPPGRVTGAADQRLPQTGKRNLSMGIIVIGPRAACGHRPHAATPRRHGQVRAGYSAPRILTIHESLRLMSTPVTAAASQTCPATLKPICSLLYLENLNRLFPEERPVYTKVRDEAPGAVRAGLQGDRTAPWLMAASSRAKWKTACSSAASISARALMVKNCVLMQDTTVDPRRPDGLCHHRQGCSDQRGTVSARDQELPGLCQEGHHRLNRHGRAARWDCRPAASCIVRRREKQI